jgi:hypothetical protein
MFFKWVIDDFSLGLIVTCICNIFTCARHYKVRNGNKIVKTDNEILMILQYQSGMNKIWWCKPFGYFCHVLLKDRFGDNYFKAMIDLWYRDQEWHPVRDAWNKIDPDFNLQRLIAKEGSSSYRPKAPSKNEENIMNH